MASQLRCTARDPGPINKILSTIIMPLPLLLQEAGYTLACCSCDLWEISGFLFSLPIETNCENNAFDKIQMNVRSIKLNCNTLLATYFTNTVLTGIKNIYVSELHVLCLYTYFRFLLVWVRVSTQKPVYSSLLFRGLSRSLQADSLS